MKKETKVTKKANTGNLMVGRNVFIRTVTHYYTGKIGAVTKHSVVLTDAAWVADTGRFGEALATGVLFEVEPYPDGPVDVMLGGIIDVCEWSHALPRKVK